MLNLALLLIISAIAVTFPALAGAEFLKDEKGTLKGYFFAIVGVIAWTTVLIVVWYVL